MQKDNWQRYLSTNLFADENGFFELPYLSNSAQSMVESFVSMPQTQHSKSVQQLSSENDFIKAQMHYRKIEEGLWLLASDLQVKQNIISKALYADDDAEEYYFLSFAVFEYTFPVNNTFTEWANLISTTCTFYRPRTEVTTYFYRGTKGRFFNFVFNRQWAANNLMVKDATQDGAIYNILNSQTGFINWINIVPDAGALSQTIFTALESEAATGTVETKKYTAVLKDVLVKAITDFFDKAIAENRINNYEPLHNPDYANVAAAEKLILHNLHLPFIGVENIAREVNVSATKLKRIFKSVFGFSMLQYHKEKNMLLALQLVKRSNMHIKNIALVTGYETAGKFTATFKKRFGMLPSEARSIRN